MKTALITGINSQDGSYLAELLLEKNYKVVGTIRAAKEDGHLWRIQGILDKIFLIETDYSSLDEHIKHLKPQEIYHLAAQSRVDESFKQGLSAYQFNIITTDGILSAVCRLSPLSRFYFAATSEMFGTHAEQPADEDTALNPLSPYAVSKTTGFYLTKMYRQAYNLFATSGILFNHESPRRGAEFVTRKITRAIAAIKAGKQKELRLGNLEVSRDWGFAGDYVQAMWKILQQDSAEDWVIATGESHTLKEFLDIAFRRVNLNWQDYVVSDPAFFRPLEAKRVLANPAKAKNSLNWKPTVSFLELVNMMVDAELKQYENEQRTA